MVKLVIFFFPFDPDLGRTADPQLLSPGWRFTGISGSLSLFLLHKWLH